MAEASMTSPASAVDVRALLGGGALPQLITPRLPGTALPDVVGQLQPQIEALLLECGGVLLRGFDVRGVDGFRAFASAFGHPLLGYEFGSTPRSRLSDGVYSSTEYPAHQHIPLHNEQSYSRSWPMKIWFYCAQAAPLGGETPIADSREVYRRVPESIRRRFDERGLLYVRNFGGGLDVPWPQAFNTNDPRQVEAYCAGHGIVCEWKEDGELRTRQVCQAVARHPRTKQLCWFNQAHLFHVSALEPEVREALLDAVEPLDLPRNVYYRDGSELETSLLDEVRALLEQEKRVFPWQSGDVLMLDNMLAAHARTPFSGPRTVVVAMADLHSATELAAS
jgi:alpha-ketoglutarate-dependent taurine dioxygenase